MIEIYLTERNDDLMITALPARVATFINHVGLEIVVFGDDSLHCLRCSEPNERVGWLHLIYRIEQAHS